MRAQEGKSVYFFFSMHRDEIAHLLIEQPEKLARLCWLTLIALNGTLVQCFQRMRGRKGVPLVKLRASPKFYQILPDKFCVLPTSKKMCQIKKELISNSLA